MTEARRSDHIYAYANQPGVNIFLPGKAMDEYRLRKIKIKNIIKLYIYPQKKIGI